MPFFFNLRLISLFSLINSKSRIDKNRFLKNRPLNVNKGETNLVTNQFKEAPIGWLNPERNVKGNPFNAIAITGEANFLAYKSGFILTVLIA